MPIHPLFGAMPYREPRSLMDVIRQNQMDQAALASKASERALREAQTKKILQGVEHPESSLAGLPPIARQRAYVESVKRAYGADSPQAIAAQQDLDLTQHNLESQLGYREALAETLPKRVLTTPSKAMVERAAIERGLAPTGKPYSAPIKPKVAGTPLATPSLENKLSGMSKDDLIKAQNAPFGSEDSATLSLYLSKQAGLGDNTKKLAYGAVLEKSLDLMKPYEGSMATYSGIEGQAKYYKDIAAAQATGKMSKQLEDYTKFSEIATSTLIPQITQYYGASVTEGQQRLLREAGNPATWKKSPQQALTAFDTLINTLENEIQTRRDLVEKPSFLTKKHAKTTPLAEQIKATGYSFDELTRRANQINRPVNDLINEILRLKGES